MGIKELVKMRKKKNANQSCIDEAFIWIVSNSRNKADLILLVATPGC